MDISIEFARERNFNLRVFNKVLDKTQKELEAESCPEFFSFIIFCQIL